MVNPVCALLLPDLSMKLARSIKGDKYMIKKALNGLSHVSLLAQSRTKFEKREKQSFQDILFRHLSSEATDPRDKVFALLESVSGDADLSKKVQPDYEKSVEEVYIGAADFIMSSNYLRMVLANAGTGWDRKFDTLPSWAPDWTDVGAPCTLGGLNCGFRASGSSNFVVQSGTIPCSKIIRVILPDAIEKLGGTNATISTQPVMKEHIPSNLPKRFSEEYSVRQNHQFKRWVRRAIGICHGASQCCQ
jgi:hypothetical protein